MVRVIALEMGAWPLMPARLHQRYINTNLTTAGAGGFLGLYM
jgi:hypothetical protein